MNAENVLKDDTGYRVDYYLLMEYGVELMEFARHKEIRLSKEVLRCIAAQIVNGLA